MVSLKGRDGEVDELTSSEPGELQVMIAKFHSQLILGFREKLKMPLARSLVGGTADAFSWEPFLDFRKQPMFIGTLPWDGE